MFVSLSQHLSPAFLPSLSLSLSQSAGEGLVRGQEKYTVFCLCLFLSLFDSQAHFSLLIALLFSSARKNSTNFRNPIDLLCQTFCWEFLIVQKSQKKKCFQPPPPPTSSSQPSLSLSAGSHFLCISNLSLCMLYSTLCWWINALAWHNRRRGALSLLLSVA